MDLVRHYFDHAATTPMRDAALTAWETNARRLGNPSAIHGAGREARSVVEEARETVADAWSIPPSTIIWTSGGTESDNLGIIGVARARRRKNPAATQVMVSPIEHHGVLDAAASLTSEGFTVIQMPLTEAGIVNYPATADLMRVHADTLAVVALMAVNNETGIIQPADRLAEVAHTELGVPFHCDAVQAHGLGPALSLQTCTAAFSAHKIGGPLGAGALVIPPDTPIEAISFGAGQESRLRSGTVPVPLVASFAEAVRETTVTESVENQRIDGLAARLESILTSVGAQIIGQNLARVGAIRYALFPGCSGQDLVVLLDARGIHVSTGSACTAGVPQPSHVLLAMGHSQDEANSGLRFSMGWTTTHDDLDALQAALPEVVAIARRR
jgi:cysteine desulfurase